LGGVEWDRSTLVAPFLGGHVFMLESCARYANQRRAFNRPIRDFQSIQNRIADMKVYIEAARLTVYRIAASKDSGVALNPLTAAVSKMYLGDRGFEMSSAVTATSTSIPWRGSSGTRSWGNWAGARPTSCG
jgi:alkylation response protein AidB-like acyl-CoA dehydrogenase